MAGPARNRPMPAAAIGAVLSRIDLAAADNMTADPGDLRAAVKHFLALLAAQAPGKSVEVRVPPYGAVQCIAGARHTRGKPPAVVEMDPSSWLALVRGQVTFTEAVERGAVRASGERSDLTAYLPLT